MRSLLLILERIIHRVLDRKSMTLLHMTPLKQRSRYRLLPLDCSACTEPDLRGSVSIASETESWGDALPIKRKFGSLSQALLFVKTMSNFLQQRLSFP